MAGCVSAPRRVPGCSNAQVRDVHRFEAKASGEQINPRIHRKGAADPPLASTTERHAPHRVADQPGKRAGQGLRVARRQQHTGRSVLDQLGDSRYPGRDTGEALALCFHQNVGQPVAVAVLGHFGGKHE